jgi:hypothetical protein
MAGTIDVVQIFETLEKDLAESGVSEQWDATRELGEMMLLSYGTLFQYEELKARNTEIHIEFLETGESLTEEDRLNLRKVSRIKKRVDKQLKDMKKKVKKAGSKK